MNAAHIAPPMPAPKAFAEVQARLAINGWALHKLEGGTFLAVRWGRSRELSDLAAVGIFAKQVGVR